MKIKKNLLYCIDNYICLKNDEKDCFPLVKGSKPIWIDDHRFKYLYDGKWYESDLTKRHMFFGLIDIFNKPKIEDYLIKTNMAGEFGIVEKNESFDVVQVKGKKILNEINGTDPVWSSDKDIVYLEGNALKSYSIIDGNETNISRRVCDFDQSQGNLIYLRRGFVFDTIDLYVPFGETQAIETRVNLIASENKRIAFPRVVDSDTIAYVEADKIKVKSLSKKIDAEFTVDGCHNLDWISKDIIAAESMCIIHLFNIYNGESHKFAGRNVKAYKE